MTVGLLPSGHVTAGAARADVARGLEGARLPGSAGDEPRLPARLEQAAADFEAVFLGRLLAQQRDSALKSDLFRQDAGSRRFETLHHEALSRAGSGTGGIADLLLRDLERRGALDAALREAAAGTDPATPDHDTAPTAEDPR